MLGETRRKVPEPLRTKEKVKLARSITEAALLELRKKEVIRNSQFRKLSTKPRRIFTDKRTLNNFTIGGNCVDITGLLQPELEKKGLSSGIVYSGLIIGPNMYYHVYLSTRFGGEEIIIDPTIGQFLLGYNHVFVGTREQLKKLYFSWKDVIARDRNESWNQRYGEISYNVPYVFKYHGDYMQTIRRKAPFRLWQ
ncbi:MAG TPA: hypothetical protein VF189_01795 [Patescibacteria group bacterium]